jgi:hypothetical protein
VVSPLVAVPLVVTLLSGCGRLQFEPRGAEVRRDAATDGGPADDASAREDAGSEDAGEPAAEARVQRLTTSLDGTRVSVSIDAVDVTRSALLFGVRADTVTSEDAHVRGWLSSPTSATFERVGSSTPVEIVSYVAELGPGAFVQRGELPGVGPTTSAALVPVPLDETVATLSHMDRGTSFGADDVYRARVATESLLAISSSASTGDSATLTWQTITIPGATVQSGDVTLSVSQLSATATASAVDLERTFLTCTWSSVISGPGIGRRLVEASIMDESTLLFRRGLGDDEIQVTWFLVTLPPPARVQTGTATFGSGTTSVDIPLATEVDLGRTVAFVSGNLRGGSTTYPGDLDDTDNPGVAWFTAELPSNGSVRLARGTTGDAIASATWFVVELP